MGLQITAYEFVPEQLSSGVATESLARYGDGDVIVYGEEGRIGEVVKVFTTATEWSDTDGFADTYLTDDGKIAGREGSPVYLVETEDQGRMPFRAGEIELMPEEEVTGEDFKQDAKDYLDKLDQASLD